MQNKVNHFAIFTEDMDRAKAFYSQVFNWSMNSYGPPDFMQITHEAGEDGELIGALQDRKYQMTEEKVIGFECTIGVDDVAAIAKLVVENGGDLLLPKMEIPGVGWIIKFKDTEGNIACAMQYKHQET